MDKPITKPRTLSGRYFPKKELILVQQTVTSFPNLSLTELAFTLCEHLSWVTPKGSNKIQSCLTALKKLDAEGYIQLPKKRQQKCRETKKIVWSAQTEAPAAMSCSLDALDSIECQPVEGKSEVVLWNEYVDRYHYLSYKHPMGAALKYFIVAKQADQPIILGCLLFSGSVWHLSDRDQWIDWTKEDREKRLNLVINNTRFLIFPWIKVPNLASKALSIVSRRIQNDWQIAHGYRPVLIDTFVGPGRYSGTC
ncbi:MAG: DUF4338 domain-containing protein [Planctomycetes bacterium]|nr:DUF4338 domain-containing protein [Planctomycetota bacterium]